MAELNIQELIEKFEQLLTSVKRDGIDKLLAYIRKSDFYRAPASTRFHSCHEGGLLEHTLNVYDCLIAKKNNPVWKQVLEEIGDESLILVALLHDICKTNFYAVEMKNKKVYSESGKKIDSNGRYDWVSVPGYTVDDKLAYGHGEGSVYIVSSYIRLTRTEAMAIRWHMLWSEPKELYNSVGNATRMHPLIIALNSADMEATYLLEEEE